MTWLRLRITAAGEDVAVEVANALLHHARSVTDDAVRPLDLTLDPPATARRFESVREWDWTSAVDRVEGLHREGVNVVVLSRRFYDWKTREVFINQEFEALDRALVELGISVVEVGELCREDRRRLSARFSDERTWHEAAAGHFVRRMGEAGRQKDLMSVPETVIDPRLTTFAGKVVRRSTCSRWVRTSKFCSHTRTKSREAEGNG